jgi:hypothetical protein
MSLLKKSFQFRLLIFPSTLSSLTFKVFKPLQISTIFIEF